MDRTDVVKETYNRFFGLSILAAAPQSRYRQHVPSYVDNNGEPSREYGFESVCNRTFTSSTTSVTNEVVTIS